MQRKGGGHVLAVGAAIGVLSFVLLVLFHAHEWQVVAVR
jgi:hypothetical protein